MSSNAHQVLAVVQYFQNRDAPEAQEDEVWSKMRNAGPVNGIHDSPLMVSGDMSREDSHGSSRSSIPDQFANPVSESRICLTVCPLTMHSAPHRLLLPASLEGLKCMPNDLLQYRLVMLPISVKLHEYTIIIKEVRRRLLSIGLPHIERRLHILQSKNV